MTGTPFLKAWGSRPDIPAKNLPTKIARLKLSGKCPMGMRIPPLKLKIMLESSPLKSRVLVRRLAVGRGWFGQSARGEDPH